MRKGIALGERLPIASPVARWPQTPAKVQKSLLAWIVDRLREQLKASIIVDNRPGGTTQAGTEAALGKARACYAELLAGNRHGTARVRLAMTVAIEPISPLRDFIAAMTRLVEQTSDAAQLIRDGRRLLAALVANDTWRPEAFAQAASPSYRHTCSTATRSSAFRL